MYCKEDIEDLLTLVDPPKKRIDRSIERKHKIFKLFSMLNIENTWHSLILSMHAVDCYIRSNNPKITFIKNMLSQWNNYITFAMELEFIAAHEKYNYFLQYVNNQEYTMQDMRLCNLENKYKLERRRQLEDALEREDLKLRGNSRICNTYIENSNSNLDISYVVSIEREMDWFFKNTDYQHRLTRAIYHHRFNNRRYNENQLSNLIKKLIVKKRMELQSVVPDFIVSKYGQ